MRAGPSYVICATPRTGSSLLLGLLDSTGVAGHPQAYFRAPDEPVWAARWQLPHSPVDYAVYVRAARAAGSTENGVFGAKLMWGTLDEVVDKLGRVHPDLAGDDRALLERAFGRLHFVYLRRADVLAQAVSWLRAEQTDTWFVGGNGEIGAHHGNGRAACFDAEEIGRLIATIEEHNTAWERWFAAVGVAPHRLSYEDVAADPVGATRGVLHLLGLELPPGRTITPWHRRQADALNDEWIERYQRSRPDRGGTPARR